MTKKESNAKKASNKNQEQNASMWWNQFDLLEGIEKSSSQVIENQKELVKGAREQFDQLEENSKKLIADWKANTLKFISENKKELGDQNYEEWLNKIEEIGLLQQQIAFMPGKTSLDILSKSTEQFEELFVNVAEQNKKLREEITNAFEGVLEQMKQSQKVMFQFFPFNPLASK